MATATTRAKVEQKKDGKVTLYDYLPPPTIHFLTDIFLALVTVLISAPQRFS